MDCSIIYNDHEEPPNLEQVHQVTVENYVDPSLNGKLLVGFVDEDHHKRKESFRQKKVEYSVLSRNLQQCHIHR